MSKIIISDVHGCYKTLMALMKKLPHNDVVFAGDLIDRGPRSKEVVDFVIKGGYDCVKGNHEDLMIAFDGVPKYNNGWGINGGFQTIISYCEEGEFDDTTMRHKMIRDDDKIREHLEWMKTLPVILEYKDIKDEEGRHLMVSHSMAQPALTAKRVVSNEEFEARVMWERDFHKIRPIEGVYNIFGHTPQDNGPRIRSFYACVDTGACYKEAPYGRLTAMEFPSMEIFEQEYID